MNELKFNVKYDDTKDKGVWPKNSPNISVSINKYPRSVLLHLMFQKLPLHPTQITSTVTDGEIHLTYTLKERGAVSELSIIQHS